MVALHMAIAAGGVLGPRIASMKRVSYSDRARTLASEPITMPRLAV